MKYAVIKTGGKQYRVVEGQVIEVELLDSKDSSYVFEEVLLTVDGDKVIIGTPTISGMKVYADVVKEVKGDKIEVFKYKSKSRYRKHTGHRQKYTQVKISGIGVKKAAVETKKVAKTPKVEKAPKTEKAVKISKATVKKIAAKKPATK
jgi:large subunit ribosomal protein L21